MTEDELKKLIKKYPTLYHMAEHGSWDSIKKHGLLSTSALLDLHSIMSPKRDRIEKMHRPNCVRIPRKNGLPNAVIRDQNPMTDNSLKKCLQDGLTPSDWYQILNRKCFFWLNPERVCSLENKYPDNDVIEICTQSLLDVHRDKIRLCHFNSGNTQRKPALRGKSTFATIDHYTYSLHPNVAELTIEYAVLDIRNHKQWVGSVKKWLNERYPKSRR